MNMFTPLTASEALDLDLRLLNSLVDQMRRVDPVYRTMASETVGILFDLTSRHDD